MPRLFRAIGVLRTLEPVVTMLAVAPAVAVLPVKLFWPDGPRSCPARAALFLIVSLVLGPGLLVNTVLKDHWARPRPGMVTNFGGTMTFRRGGIHAAPATRNCSFVSGETSSAVWLTAPALLLPRRGAMPPSPALPSTHGHRLHAAPARRPLPLRRAVRRHLHRPRHLDRARQAPLALRLSDQAIDVRFERAGNACAASLPRSPAQGRRPGEPTPPA